MEPKSKPTVYSYIVKLENHAKFMMCLIAAEREVSAMQNCLNNNRITFGHYTSNLLLPLVQIFCLQSYSYSISLVAGYLLRYDWRI